MWYTMAITLVYDQRSEYNEATLTEGTALVRQSRDRNLHIRTRAIGVRVHNHSSADGSASPVRQHGDVLRADRVVVNGRSITRAFMR
jgi:hypothetical protein